MTTDRWEMLPRLLGEICGGTVSRGHGRRVDEVFRLDYESGGHTWLCRSCWVEAWIAAGRPEQGARR